MCKTKAADRKAQSTQMRMPSSQAEMSFILFSNTVGKNRGYTLSTTSRNQRLGH